MNQRTTDVRPIAREVAEHLNQPWTFDHEANARYGAHLGVIAGHGEMRIMLRLDRGRIRIRGGYPRDGNKTMGAGCWGAVPYNESGPTITVAATRCARDVAQEIRRRFLSEYLAVYSECYGRAVERDAKRSTAWAAAHRNAHILGDGQIDSRQQDQDRPRVNLYGDVWGEFLHSGEGADIELRNVPHALAHRIAGLVAKHNESAERCGHSACSQNYIDTGDTQCVATAEVAA